MWMRSVLLSKYIFNVISSVHTTTLDLKGFLWSTFKTAAEFSDNNKTQIFI